MRKVLPITLTFALAITPAALAESEYFGAAESGDAQAQYELAEYYYTQERDFAKAAEWMTKAAEQGVVQAQLELGLYYYTGQGVEADMEEAMRWWQSAADQGNTQAMRYIGYLYEAGEGVTANAETAVSYYMQAAELGDAEAQYTMGYCYEEGIGVAADAELSTEYFTQSASNGDRDAQSVMGMRYFEQGNYARAQVYLQAAATQGEMNAQYTMGYMFAEGVGVDKDEEQARYWWTMAGENGSGDAIMGLYYLNKGDASIEVLSSGVSNSAVRKLQEALIAMGYLNGTASGVYDSSTQAAVKLFQEAHGLNATGTADPETQAYIEFQDLSMYVAKVDFISLQNPDVTPRLFVSFKNTGDRTITEIVFEVAPIDASDENMAVYNSYETITCTSERVLKPGETDAKGYYWTLNGCRGVRGVKLAISSVTFEDGTVETKNDGALNWITYTSNNR